MIGTGAFTSPAVQQLRQYQRLQCGHIAPAYHLDNDGTLEALAMRLEREPIPGNIRVKIFSLWHNRCAYCDDDATQIEHVLPYSRGGTDNELNLVAACSKCNVIAGARVFNDFEQKKLYILKKRGLPYDGHNTYTDRSGRVWRWRTW